MTKTLKFEELGDNHLFKIKQIAEKVWPDTFSAILSSEQIKYMMDMMYSLTALQKQSDQGCKFILVYENGTEAGFVSYQLNHPEPQVVKIHKIYFLQEFQGKGLGKLLLTKVAQIALKKQCHTITLNVNRFNTNAIKAYEKIGFSVTKTEDINIGNGFLMEDYKMDKTIG